MKPTQSILIILFLFFISNCGDKVREVITERYDDGNKKLLVKYKGEGGDEVVIERITYGSRGDTLYWEKPLEDFYYEKVREEITERYDDGSKKLLVKYKGEGVDEVVVERITYNESGDTLRVEKPLQKMEMWRTYFGNGQIKEEYNYKDGKIDGKKIWYYEDGLIWIETNYKDGEVDWSNEYTFYPNGQIGSEKNYKDGELDGKVTSYYEDGQIMIEGNIKEGKINFINFWNKNGELMVKDGNGRSIIYYENGQIQIEGNIKDGKREGILTFYYENGQIEEEGNYKDGEKDGKWTTYNEDGSIKEVEEYKDGELVE